MVSFGSKGSLCNNSHGQYKLLLIRINFFCLWSLTKNYRERPKYAELLESDFIKQYENADVDVASWFSSVMQMSNDPQNSQVRR